MLNSSFFEILCLNERIPKKILSVTGAFFNILESLTLTNYN